MKISYPRSSRQQLIERLKRQMEDLNRKLPLKWVVLFGSYAQGNFTVASDVDLLVVYDGDPKDNAYALVRRTLDIPGLEPHIYSSGEYAQLKDMIMEMAGRAVVLFPEHEFADPLTGPSDPSADLRTGKGVPRQGEEPAPVSMAHTS